VNPTTRRTIRRTIGRAQLASVKGAAVLSAMLIPGEKPSIDRSVVLETWKAVADGAHNSNTDLTFWNGHFYLCHQTSPYHLGSSRSRHLLWRSMDAHNWEKVTEFKAPTWEYRDPKFGQIGARLFIYALPNESRMAEPTRTVVTSSLDGTDWSPIEDVEPRGWLFWRPKTLDNKTWYVTAYWHEHGRSQLLKSSNGIDWETVSYIWEGERNDETDFEFMPDGRILATARLEGHGGMQGDKTSSTLLAVAEPPYTDWTYEKSYVTRFDGPCLFPYNGRIYGVGRYQSSRFPQFLEQGGLWSRKRTSIFLVEPDKLTRLTDFPSAGDTSYAGIVIRGDELFASYYTSSIKRDPVWVQGMFAPTDIRMARVSLPALERLAATTR
jgi:hypothetical protein